MGVYDYEYGSKVNKNGNKVISIKDFTSSNILYAERKGDNVQIKMKRSGETIGISVPVELLERLLKDIKENSENEKKGV
ncbi:hypothetical protein HPT25_27265 [Bacillus sp. BRMEA1]|uniref:hypothetical protein n=1 Tax=Neobacillus endophyticus TaxID=2738405 RepID=UPI0015637EE4|nr:hypothetical protein [Neobacillus endophyticus]NRD81023.1 hypothetical protein [Neobacillus endophyticus]